MNGSVVPMEWVSAIWRKHSGHGGPVWGVRVELSPKAWQGLPWRLSGKESSSNVRDMGLIPRSGRYPGKANANRIPYSCLENPMDRGSWWLQSMGSQRVRHNLVAKKKTTKHHRALSTWKIWGTSIPHRKKNTYKSLRGKSLAVCALVGGEAAGG